MEKVADNYRTFIEAMPMGLKLQVNHKYEYQICSLVTIMVQPCVRAVLVGTSTTLNLLIPSMVLARFCIGEIWARLRQWDSLKPAKLHN